MNHPAAAVASREPALDLSSLMTASPPAAHGSSLRPQFSPAEAANFTPEHYLARGGLLSAPDGPWQPAAITTARADFTVGQGGSHRSVQEAVNAAIRSGQTARQFIRILPGTYTGAVYIPGDAPALTIYGGGAGPEEVRIELCIDSRMSVAEYRQRINPQGQFQPGDPAWEMYQACAGRADEKIIDTPAAAVFWSQASDLQLKNFSLINTLLDTVDGGTHQAVALRSDGDRCQLEDMRLIGRQDTFFCNSGEAPHAGNRLGAYPADRIARLLARHCYIEGDTDYVFGNATAVFQDCEFHSVSSRRQRPAIVFAPNTCASRSLGFLAIACRFSADAWLQEDRGSFLGRSWDQGAGTTGYLPGQTANGQLVVRESHIERAYHLSNPWDHAATTRRPHRGNADPARNLDDPAFNRLWEYANYGPGAWQPENG